MGTPRLDKKMMNELETIKLLTAGTVNIYSENELINAINTDKKLKVKLGADPTAPDLHLGHAVVFSKLKQRVLTISELRSKFTPGEICHPKKYRSIFTLRESLGSRISFVVQGSRYAYTASPWTPRICNFRNFCIIEVNLAENDY